MSKVNITKTKVEVGAGKHVKQFLSKRENHKLQTVRQRKVRIAESRFPKIETAGALLPTTRGPASAAITSGHVQTALSNARRAPRPRSLLTENAHPVKR
jgi:hypothetical protein